MRFSPAADDGAHSRPLAGTGAMARYRELVAQGELTPDPHQAQIVTRLSALADALAGYRPMRTTGIGRLLSLRRRVVPPRGIYIHGGVGRGKSMLMDLFFAGAPIADKQRAHFHEFMQDVHERIHKWRIGRRMNSVERADPIPDVAAEIADNATLLCFDEFQVTDITDAMILGRLFQGLLSRGVVVVATSNLAPDRLYENGLNRGLFLPFIRLIEERMDVVVLGGDTDYRLSRLKGMPVYYTPLDAESRQRMQDAWHRLTDRACGEPRILELKGRVIEVPEAAWGVARFSFSDLCESPRGAADYLKIARSFHTVLIDDIPQLGRQDSSAARRFTTLVDTFYEHRVKLIVSAAVMPDELYVEGPGADEFARTASRLVEMQSARYLALGHGV